MKRAATDLDSPRADAVARRRIGSMRGSWCRCWSGSAGETGVWREVHVPSASDEAARHVSREHQQLTPEQTRLVNQMRSWLACSGAALPARAFDSVTRFPNGTGRGRGHNSPRTAATSNYSATACFGRGLSGRRGSMNGEGRF